MRSSLEIGRVSLEPLASEHVARLAPLLEVPAVREGLGRWQTAYALLEKELVGAARGNRIPFVLVEDGECLGLCGLSRHGLPFHRLDVYYWLGVRHWGRGLASRAVASLVTRAQEEEDVTELTSIVRAANARSRRVLERNGFTELRRGFGKHFGRADLGDEEVLELVLPLSFTSNRPSPYARDHQDRGTLQR